MTPITQLESEQFLGKLYNVADSAVEYLKTVGFAEIRKKMPVFNDNDTEEQRAQKMQEQGMKNFVEMLKAACVTHPKETTAFLESLFVFEDGEEKPKGFKLLVEGLKVVGDKNVLDFFTYATKALRIASVL